MDVLPAAWTVAVIARLKVQSIDGRILILSLSLASNAAIDLASKIAE